MEGNNEASKKKLMNRTQDMFNKVRKDEEQLVDSNYKQKERPSIEDRNEQFLPESKDTRLLNDSQENREQEVVMLGQKGDGSLRLEIGHQ